MNTPIRSTASESASGLNRRQFLASAGATALSLSVLQPAMAAGAASPDKIKLGLIGCGGRGSWIANLFQKQGGYDLVAVADYFPDRTAAVGQKLGIPESRQYTGLSGYRRLLEQPGLEAVAIESPPYFHPEQAAMAVAAGKHVYVAKPVAVDVPGCQTIAQSGERARDRKLCFLVDFQTRADSFYIEAIRRLHQGDLGQLVFGEAIYHAECPFRSKYKYLETDPANPENRLRAWGLDRVLSGDIIVEQNIHTLDVMSWIMDQAPEYAVGTGGRKVRKFGDCCDYFALLFQYPNQVGITFSSRQIVGHGTQPDGIRNRMFGSQGVLETAYGGQVMIRGEKFFDGGRSPGIYQEGAVANIAAFHRSIREGDCQNLTVAPSVRSNLVSILGRTAAYQPGQVVTWDDLLRRNEKLEFDVRGMKG
ncbi:MAG TPA: Gfo/Idh/MocA family oxidoreductase [Candidatus Paceibacterota bacterium]|nr:Gfo/Idh/MocA family oxidoreductase [Verrucomicrobiota bacterium]HRZ46365.1 Gfo/Idh/MocA family oxidoreductase [Candidatus Paceibacterota bacterium]